MAYWLYVRQPAAAEWIGRRFAVVHRVLLNKYYVDEIYDAVVVRPLLATAEWLWRVWDTLVIDGLVNGTARMVQAGGLFLRFWQTGNVQAYALSLSLGAIVLFAYYLGRVLGVAPW